MSFSRGAAAALPVHRHTTGAFLLVIHASRIEECCAPPPAHLSSSSAVTEAFLDSLVSEVRTVVGSSLFAVIGKGSSVAYSPKNVQPSAATVTEATTDSSTVTQNAYFVVTSLTQRPQLPQQSTGLSSQQQQQPQSFTLRVKDSRLSAALAEVMLRSKFISLTNCRLQPLPSPSVGGGDADRSDPKQMNLDPQLYDAIQRALERVPFFASRVLSSSSTFDVATLLAEEEAFVASVNYAAVFTEPGSEEASPFATLMFILFKMRATREELSVLARHQNRYLRAAVLYYARYTIAPEELATFFAPSMSDETIISCAGDSSQTRSMKEIAHLLLDDDEIDEAWLPRYTSWWKQMVIAPLKVLMAEHREVLQKAAINAMSSTNIKSYSSSNGDALSEFASGARKRPRHESNGATGKPTLMGFRSAVEFAMFVDQARLMAAGERVAQLVGEATAFQEDDDDDEEAAWARRHGMADGAPAAPSGQAVVQQSSQQRPNAVMPAAASAMAAAVKKQATVDLRKLASSHGQRAILELLGPSAASRVKKDDPIYLEF